jgi:prepilin-type N-terminal cleavage/methylation domain-containing protein
VLTTERTTWPASVTRSGFSLAELLVAIAILGVGLTMAAGLFPAALAMNQDSTRNTVGSMICENGAAIAQAVLTHPLSGASYGTWTDCTDEIDDELREYLDGTSSNQGFMVLATPVVNDLTVNDYRLAIVSYRLHDPGNDIELFDVNQPVEAKDDLLNISSAGTVSERAQLVGSAVFALDGRYARIERLDDDPDGAILDRVLRPKTTDPVVVVRHALRETGNPGPRSPVMAVMMLRTALRPGS